MSSEQPCMKCGSPTLHVVEVWVNGVKGATLYVCETCHDDGMLGIEPWHRRFKTLLANGVSRKRANEILIGMMNRGAH